MGATPGCWIYTHYSLMCQFPSENAPNSCNPLQIFRLEVFISPKSSPPVDRLDSDRIQVANVRTFGLSAWMFFSPPADVPSQASLASTHKKLYAPSRLSPELLWLPSRPYSIPLCLCTRLPELSVSRFLTDETYEPERAIFGIRLGYRYRSSMPFGRYDPDNDIRESRNAAGNERPTSCPAMLSPRKAIRKDPLSFPPGQLLLLRRISPSGECSLGVLVGSLIYQFGERPLHTRSPSSSRSQHGPLFSGCLSGISSKLRTL
jgi:hypothetical protein